MARNLPWTIKNSSSNSRSTSSAAAVKKKNPSQTASAAASAGAGAAAVAPKKKKKKKREKEEEASSSSSSPSPFRSDSDGERDGERDGEKRIGSKSSTSVKGGARRKRASSRTPSTSPPPEPPDEEYMLEGYDHDDIYIMVEDEFHSVAQTFTRHLHHAEYQRLKKTTRRAAPPTFRPVDAMKTETKKKLEAGALRARQKDVIGNMTNGVESSGEEDEEQDDDPWLGTSLAGLMTDGHDRKRTALVGLDKIQSDTRAARGYGRGTGVGPADRREKMSVFDIFSKASKCRDAVAHDPEHENSELEPDGPLKAKANPRRATAQRVPNSQQIGVSSQHVPENLTIATELPPFPEDAPTPKAHKRFREPSVAARRLLDDFDNLETVEKMKKDVRKSRPSPSCKDGKRKQAKDRKMEIGDIPTFLV